MKKELEKVFNNFTSAELVKNLSTLGVPCGEIKTMTQVLADKENYEQNLLTTYIVAGNKITVPTGGIFYNNIEQIPYKPASKLNSKITKTFEKDHVNKAVELLNLCFLNKKNNSRIIFMEALSSYL